MSESKQTQNYLSFEEAIKHASKKPAPGPIWKSCLNDFIFFYLIAILLWSTKFIYYEPTTALIHSYIEKPVQALGWYQCFAAFGPYVRDTNFHETAVITFKDGSCKIYEYPRMNKMSLWERFRREKLRKMFSDCMPWPGYKILLPVFARHLAQANHNPDNPPVCITFVFNWIRIDRPEGDKLVLRSELPEHTKKEVTFTYRVTSSDLDI